MKESSNRLWRIQAYLVFLIGSWLLSELIVHIIAKQNMRIAECSDTEKWFAAALWVTFSFGACFTTFFRKVDANEVEIWANPYIKETIPADGEFTGKEEIHGQRALRAGWNLLLPGEYLVEGGVMEMNKKIIVEIAKESYKTSDTKQLEVTARVVLTILPPYEVNHFRYIMGNGDSEKGYEELSKYFRGEVRAFIQSYMITRTADDIQKNLDAFKKAFKEEMFGGLHAMDDREKRTGTWTGEPVLERVQEVQAVLDAESLESQLDLVKKLQKDVMAEKGAEIPAGTAWQIALAMAGKATMEVKDLNLNLSGAENLSNLNVNLGGGMGGLGGSGGKNKQGGKGNKGKGGGKNQPANTPPPTADAEEE
jgi:hypothetical protein